MYNNHLILIHVDTCNTCIQYVYNCLYIVVYRQTATDNGQSIALTLRPLRGPLHPCWKLQNYGASFLVWKTVETYGNIGKKLETMGKNMKTWETG